MTDDPHLLAMDHDEGPCIYCDLQPIEHGTDDRHEAIIQPGSNICACGLPGGDSLAHIIHGLGG